MVILLYLYINLCSCKGILVFDLPQFDINAIVNGFSSFSRTEIFPNEDIRNIIKITPNHDPSMHCSCIKFVQMRNFYIFQRKNFQKSEDYQSMKMAENYSEIKQGENQKIDKSISIVGEFPNIAGLFRLFIKNDFKTSIGFTNSSTFVLSSSPNIDTFSNESEFTLIENSKIFDFLAEENPKVKLFVYSNLDSNELRTVCNKMIPVSFHILSLTIFIIFCCLFSIRLYYFTVPKIFKNHENIGFWVIGPHGSIITYPKLIFSSHQLLKFKKMYKKAKRTKKPQNSIIRTNNSALEKATFERIHFYNLNDTIQLIVLWNESFPKYKKSVIESVYGKCLAGDCENFTNVEVNIKADDNHTKYAEINLEIDNIPCKIDIRPKDICCLPFGLESLNYYYLHQLHYSVVKDISNCNLNRKEFEEITSRIFRILDFEAFFAFHHSNSKYTELVGHYKTNELKLFAREFSKNVPLFKTTNRLFLSFLGESRFGGVRFKVASDEYIIGIALKTSNFVIRPAEAHFVFIMQIIFSFHHSILSPKKEYSIFYGFHRIIDTVNRFTLIKAVGSHRNFVSVYGNLFKDEILTTENFEHFFSVVGQNDSANLVLCEIRTEYTQVIVPFTRANGKKAVVSVSGITYYDDTVNANAFLYFIEDVTCFHDRALNLRAKHRNVEMVEDFLKFYRVHADLSVEENKVLSRELGYIKPIENLSEIIYAEDIAFLENKKTPNVFRLMSADNYPLQFVKLPIKGETDFFIVCIWKIRTMLQLAENEIKIRQQDHETTQHYLYMSIDRKSETPLDMMCNFSGDYSPCQMYDHIKAVLYNYDRSSFDTNMENVRTGSLKSCSLILRIRMKDGHEWFNFTLMLYGEETIMLLALSCNKQVKTKIQALDDFRMLDTAFTSSKFIMWIFEDAVQPERVFSSLPVGTNFLILNWTTIDKNVAPQYKDSVKHTFKQILKTKSKMDILIPMFIEKVRWLLFRGSIDDADNAHLKGVAVDITDLIEPWENSQKEKKTRNLYIHNASTKMESLFKRLEGNIQTMEDIRAKLQTIEKTEHLMDLERKLNNFLGSPSVQKLMSVDV